MKSILLQLYDGEIHPAEQYIPKSKEYWKMRRKHHDHYEDFIQELKKSAPSLQKRFIQIMDEQLDEFPFEMSEMFIDGFRLGARMMIEVYQNNLSDAEK